MSTDHQDIHRGTSASQEITDGPLFYAYARRVSFFFIDIFPDSRALFADR